MNRPIAIQIRNLRYSYPGGGEVLRGVDLDVYEGETLGVIGPNGAGKSTLALHMNGLLRSEGGGEVLVFGTPVNRANLRLIRQSVGLVFQNPDDQLFSPKVFDDVAFGPRNMGLPPDEVKKRSEEALEAVGLPGFGDRIPHHLSFGEKKRVSIATVLSMRPKAVVFDEPTANLDPEGQELVMETIRRMDCARVIITHDILLSGGFCDRIAVMNSGKVVACGAAEDILRDKELLAANKLLFHTLCVTSVSHKHY